MLDKFKKTHETAISEIESFLNRSPTDYDYGMVPLIKWMLATDANPYSYLPYEWACSFLSAESFVTLINHIHHALYDDGDITFVRVNGEPRIVFVWAGEDDFESLVISGGEKTGSQIHGRYKNSVEVLDITPGQFCELYDIYYKEQVRDWFMLDSSRGIEWAVTHYRQYRCWDESWITEAHRQNEIS